MTDEITREMFQHSTVVIAGLNDRITALEAENERLREALTGIVEFGERHPGHGYSCARIARAALGVDTV